VIPFEALLDANDKTASVFVYEQGKAIKRRIKTGSVVDDRIVVSDGLKEGEFVITDGVKYVRDDSEVTLLDQTESNIQ